MTALSAYFIWISRPFGQTMVDKLIVLTDYIAMKHLRHDRPSLRLLDNLVREKRKLVGLKETEAQPTAQLKPIPQRLLRPMNERAHENVLKDFEALPNESQIAIYDLMGAQGDLMSARSDRMKDLRSLSNPKKVAAYNAALSELYEKCRRFNEVCRTERRANKSPTREWWSKLRLSMGSEWPYDETDDILAETRKKG